MKLDLTMNLDTAQTSKGSEPAQGMILLSVKVIERSSFITKHFGLVELYFMH